MCVLFTCFIQKSECCSVGWIILFQQSDFISLTVILFCLNVSVKNCVERGFRLLLMSQRYLLWIGRALFWNIRGSHRQLIFLILHFISSSCYSRRSNQSVRMSEYDTETMSTHFLKLLQINVTRAVSRYHSTHHYIYTVLAVLKRISYLQQHTSPDAESNRDVQPGSHGWNHERRRVLSGDLMRIAKALRSLPPASWWTIFIVQSSLRVQLLFLECRNKLWSSCSCKSIRKPRLVFLCQISVRPHTPPGAMTEHMWTLAITIKPRTLP
jgi:hypothetical protein